MGVSVQEAMARGRQMIEVPPRYIQALTAVVVILLIIIDRSWWWLLLIPLCMLACTLYAMWATPKWRIWAYENVEDIHQFERSAELAGYIAPQQYDKPQPFASSSQQERLKELEERFETDAVFIDDPSIPEETQVYTNIFDNKTPIFTLSAQGMKPNGGDWIKWNEIENERIARISYHGMSAKTGEDGPLGSADFVRFETPQGRIEYNISSLNISKWKLDLLFYIYRGRSESNSS